MLEISSKTNLLEQKSYKYSLQDVEEPNLQRDIYSYGSIPKVAFNHRRVPMNMPEETMAPHITSVSTRFLAQPRLVTWTMIWLMGGGMRVWMAVGGALRRNAPETDYLL